ncbi:alcohol dehydrogenase (NADP(+)) [Salvia divinorum]|uniref:Alcohol dehydrogenase (NADP(+)) n=1 Tax=Salvia divinorum TaxID=28513 RepID=A0ABD1FHR1_SALDI
MRGDQVRLNNGMIMPVIGMGTYSFENDRKSTDQAVQLALTMGYRHFDTARIYGSEAALGGALNEAIANGVVEREDVFVTSKLWGSHHHDPVSALQKTLMIMGMEYIDMYLVHWPVRLKSWVCDPIPKEDEFEPLCLDVTWSGMEKCLEMGLCKGIGVSNFSCKKLQNLLDFAFVPPAINQVEMHPMWRQKKLRGFCRNNNIHVSAYSPLGGPGNLWGSTVVIEDPVIKSLALKHRATPAQIALSWGLLKGASVIVKSFNQERMKENKGALDLKLEDEEILEIDTMFKEMKILRGEVFVNQATSPYKTLHDLWDDEI